MKHEWRKHEKQFYIPKRRAELIEIPKFQFLTIRGRGNPNKPEFQNYIKALYTLSYGIKMTLKKEQDVPNYQDYTVYPLEGIWSLSLEAQQSFNGKINKDDFVFQLMIRQADFVTNDYFEKIRRISCEKHENTLLEKVKFETIEEGKCVQMLHVGSFDNEAETFEIMEAFAKEKGLKRLSKEHREIYLSDFRRVAPDKMKTTLRFLVES